MGGEATPGLAPGKAAGLAVDSRCGHPARGHITKPSRAGRNSATRVFRSARDRGASRGGVDAASRPQVRGIDRPRDRGGGSDRRPALQGRVWARRRGGESEVSARRRAVGREPAAEPPDVGPRQGAGVGGGGEHHARDRAGRPGPLPPQVACRLGGARHRRERGSSAAQGHRAEAHRELLGRVRSEGGGEGGGGGGRRKAPRTVRFRYMKHWHETREVLDFLARVRGEGKRAALATVVRVRGSAYRHEGAKLAVADDGTTAGNVSGGCLEQDVREVALQVIRSGKPELRNYCSSADEIEAWDLGVGCEGQVDVFVEPA